MTGKHKNKHKNQKGFTLIETLVAVMILATAVAGPLSIASRSLNNSLIAKDQVTAFFLAQDAVEYVRFVRDSNTLRGADWLSGAGGSSAGTDLTPCVYNVNTNPNGCYVDSTGSSYTDVNGNNPSVPVMCPVSGVCPVLYYDGTHYFFTYNSSGNTSTLFSRQIVITSLSSTEIQVTVTVSWSDIGGVARRVVVYENLFKWQ